MRVRELRSEPLQVQVGRMWSKRRKADDEISPSDSINQIPGVRGTPRHAHATHTPCTYHAHTVHAPCTRHAHTVHTPCTPHAHTVHAPVHAPVHMPCIHHARAIHRWAAATLRGCSCRASPPSASSRPWQPRPMAASRCAGCARATTHATRSTTSSCRHSAMR